MLQTWAKQQQGQCQDYCKYEGVTTWNLDANCKGCGASMAEAAVNSSTTCSTWTGGTCVFSNCDGSRGAVQCNWAKACVCAPNFCANDQGICVFDLQSVLR